MRHDIIQRENRLEDSFYVIFFQLYVQTFYFRLCLWTHVGGFICLGELDIRLGYEKLIENILF